MLGWVDLGVEAVDRVLACFHNGSLYRINFQILCRQAACAYPDHEHRNACGLPSLHFMLQRFDTSFIITFCKFNGMLTLYKWNGSGQRPSYHMMRLHILLVVLAEH